MSEMKCGHDLPWRDDCDDCQKDRILVMLTSARMVMRQVKPEVTDDD